MKRNSSNSATGEPLSGKRVKIGIKMKLLGFLLPIVVTVLTIIVVVINVNASRIVMGKSETILDTSTQSVVNQVAGWISKTTTALEQQRDTLEYLNQDAEGELDYIKHTVGQYDAFPAGIYVATIEGKLLHDSFVPGPEYSFYEKSWYIEGLESENFLLGPVYFDENSQALVVGASGVMKDGAAKVTGVAAADISLDAISNIVSQVQIEQTGGMFLVDLRTDTIIGHKDKAMVGTMLGEQTDGMYQFVSEKIKSDAKGLQTYSSGKDQTYIDFMSVPGSDWITVAYVPNKEVMADINKLNRDIIVVAAVGMVFLVLFMERLIHIIVKPVKKLNHTISAITEGDFTMDAVVNSTDEIGNMAAGLQKFIVSMRGIINEIGQVSGKMSLQSERNEAVSGQLFETAEVQNHSMGEMTHTINELTLSIMEVAGNATNLAQLMEETRDKGVEASAQMEIAVKASSQGKDDMQRVVGSMSEISVKIDALEISSGKMDGSVVEINSIVELIRNIAEETNLLSLNASIEAARAGEAGRGFAVVADQIGKLALTSKNAVDNIASLTRNISEQVEQTVRQTGESADSIKESTVIVNQTGENFSNIYETIGSTGTMVSEMVTRVQKVNDIAASLAGITQEQSASSEEILAAAEKMQENSQMLNESSQQIQEEAEHSGQNAELLKGHMSKFKVD